MDDEVTLQPLATSLDKIDALRSQISEVTRSTTPLTPGWAQIISYHLSDIIASVENLCANIRQHSVTE